MTGPHDADSVAYWKHLAEQAQAEAALYRGMVGQHQIALRQLLDIWDAGMPDETAREDMVEAFDAVRKVLGPSSLNPVAAWPFPK